MTQCRVLGMQSNLEYFLHPRSVAIVGVSRNPRSFGYPLAAIARRKGYAGKLHLVNPRADSILGLKCYPSVRDIPGQVDVAVVMTPASAVAAAMEDCVKKGVKGVVVITAGFAEKDAEGRDKQAAIIDTAVGNGIRVIGPNTMGYYSAPANLDLLMAGFIRKGSTALVTQSGNLSHSLTFPGAERGLGFRYVICLGNQSDLQVHECVSYLREDPGTSAVAIHIEGLRDGRRFMEEVRKTAAVKPVVILKGGRTEIGARVASSHTASMAGNDEIYSAALRQCGAIQVESFTEFASVLLAFSAGKIPAGNRICVISQGGGDCAHTGDACTMKGLDLPELCQDTQRELRSFVPENGCVSNPVDLAGWENVARATKIVLGDEAIDGIIVAGGFAGFHCVSPDEYAREQEYVRTMIDLAGSASAPLLIYSFFSYAPGNRLIDMLRQAGIPLFLDHVDAVNAMAALVRYAKIKAAVTGRSFPAELEDAGNAGMIHTTPKCRQSLTEPLAKQLLAGYGLPRLREETAENAEEAAAAAERIGFPVAVKVISPDILHKSDAGCVRLGLESPEAVREAGRDIMSRARDYDANAKIEGLLVSEMCRQEGTEVIIGGVNDPVFGPVIMFGIGGILVEVMKDISLRICPIDEADADEMIREIRGFAVLEGVRGGRPADINALKSALLNVSRLLAENPRIAELDINPIKVHEEGLSVLDARIITAQRNAVNLT